MARVPGDATAFATRDADFILNVVARAPERGRLRAGRRLGAATAPSSGRHRGVTYVNFTGEASADRVRASYPPATYARLVAVKDRYDPTNLFRLNQNIPPSQP